MSMLTCRMGHVPWGDGMTGAMRTATGFAGEVEPADQGRRYQ
jgi:hypothetical protein